MVTYGTTTIPSDEITVVSGGTVQVSAAFERSVAIMGGMDTGNGTATDGDVVEVTSPSDAQSKFGDGSELHEACKMAFNNGAGEVWALPVAESTSTSEQQSTQSGTLDNAPLFDTTIHDEHTISVVDTGGTDPSVNIVHETGTLSTPSTDQVNINPTTGEYKADASPTGSNYEFTYDYGDYSSAEIADLVDKETRIVVVLTENESVVNNLATELDNQDDDFVFQHGVAGAAPFADTSSLDTSNYSDGVDDMRITLVAPSRGYIDDAETDEHRTASAVGGYLCSLELGLSATNDSIDGLTALRADMTFSEAKDLIDNQVMPLIDYPPVTIIKDMTTSTTTRFERVYSNQIVDEAAELSHEISRIFVGEQNTAANRQQLRRSHRNTYIEMRDDNPPLLDDFSVTVKENSSNDNQVDVEIGLDVVDVMDTIKVTITVGDIIQNGGVS